MVLSLFHRNALRKIPWLIYIVTPVCLLYTSTNGAELAFFTTKTGLRVDGWTEINPDTGKTSNKGGLTRDVNDTNQSWYKACIGSKARNSIYSVFSDPYKDVYKRQAK